MDIHSYVMRIGEFAGRKITAVPSGYLRKIVKARIDEWKAAELELQRRGTEVPVVDLSAHAVDRASCRLIDHWRATRIENEGFYTWLARLAEAALNSRKPAIRNGSDVEVKFCGLRFLLCVPKGNKPRLKTIVPLDDGIMSKREVIESISNALGRSRKKGRDHGNEFEDTGT